MKKIFFFLLIYMNLTTFSQSNITEELEYFKITEIKKGLPAEAKEVLTHLNENKFSYAVLDSSTSIFALIEQSQIEGERLWLFSFTSPLKNSIDLFDTVAKYDTLLIAYAESGITRINFTIVFQTGEKNLFYKKGRHLYPGINFLGGISVEPFFMIAKELSGTGTSNEQNTTHIFFSPISFYFFAGFDNANKFGLYLKAGIMYGSENFSGFEYGIFIFAKVPESSFYITGGVNFHANGGQSHGTAYYEEAYSETFTLLGIGMGYHLSKKISAELSGFFPLKQNYGYIHSAFENERYDKELYTIIKLGIRIQF